MRTVRERVMGVVGNSVGGITGLHSRQSIVVNACIADVASPTLRIYVGPLKRGLIGTWFLLSPTLRCHARRIASIRIIARRISSTLEWKDLLIASLVTRGTRLRILKS